MSAHPIPVKMADPVQMTSTTTLALVFRDTVVLTAAQISSKVIIRFKDKYNFVLEFL